jgi:hypothetical protein
MPELDAIKEQTVSGLVADVREANREAACFRRPKAPRRANKTSRFVGIAADRLSE